MRIVPACLLALMLASPAMAATLEGDWETVIFSPRRPWIFDTHFRHAGNAWSGAMTIRGYGDLPLSGVDVSGERVRFVFPAQLDSLAFEGVLQDSAIVGQVSEAGRPEPVRLARILPVPAVSDRVEAWRRDLEYAALRFPAYDRGLGAARHEEFARALRKIEFNLTQENDAQILVGLARAVALADNAHTRLRLDPTTQGGFSTELPLACWWFADGPYVVRAAPPYARALRCRLVALDGVPVAEARRQVSQLFGGNESWGDYLSPIYLMMPDVLYGLGIAPSRSAARLTLEDARGRKFDLRVRAIPVDRSHALSESWQEISPLTSMGDPPWTPALLASADLPLYLQHPDKAYWFEFEPKTGLLYFQFNRSEDDDRGPPFQAFGDSLLAFVRSHAVRDVVIDLRLNSGGNLDVAKPFMRSLGGDPAIDRPGHLFVITGHVTFSAGIYHASQLRQFTHATFVGEPVGDRLDFWAEGGEILLPYSHAVIHYSNGFHGYSGKDHPENRPYYEELNVSSLGPDVAAPLRAADYFARRDPALEAITARLAATAASPRSTP